MNALTTHPTAAPDSLEALAHRKRPLTREDKAQPFTVSPSRYRELADMSDADRRLSLALDIRAHDFNNRQIIGVYGSLSPLGQMRWHDRWAANEAAHMARAEAAYEAARIGVARFDLEPLHDWPPQDARSVVGMVGAV